MVFQCWSCRLIIFEDFFSWTKRRQIGEIKACTVNEKNDALFIIISKFSVALRKIGSSFDDERRIFIWTDLCLLLIQIGNVGGMLFLVGLFNFRVWCRRTQARASLCVCVNIAYQIVDRERTFPRHKRFLRNVFDLDAETTVQICEHDQITFQ